MPDRVYGGVGELSLEAVLLGQSGPRVAWTRANAVRGCTSRGMRRVAPPVVDLSAVDTHDSRSPKIPARRPVDTRMPAREPNLSEVFTKLTMDHETVPVVADLPASIGRCCSDSDPRSDPQGRTQTPRGLLTTQDSTRGRGAGVEELS